MSTDVRKLVEQVAAEADATRDEPMPPGSAATKPNRSVPVAVRLAPEDALAIEALATKLDVPMLSLLRGWILTALAAQRDESVSTAIDRIAADVQRLREIVA
jgi:hypothetical protein